MAAPTMTADDAQWMLDQLDAGAFDAYMTAVARERMRTDALQALDRPPVAEVVTVGTTRRGGRVVTVRCPHCTKLHVHGWVHGDAEPGMRNAHCLKAAPYFIPAPGDEPPSCSNPTEPGETALTSPDVVAGVTGQQKGAPR
jgi:hypothetical protein